MPVKLDVSLLRQWLGPEGAVAGLERSHMTNAELLDIALENDIQVDKKTARRQMAIEIIMAPLNRIDKEPDLLLAMTKDELQKYFAERMASNIEIRRLLERLGLAPSGKLRTKLSEFAANEISELGVFQRVAKGIGAERH